jgi:hypothetical protein
MAPPLQSKWNPFQNPYHVSKILPLPLAQAKNGASVLSFLLLTFPPLFLRENLKFQKKMAEMPAFPFANTVIHIPKEIRLSKYPTPTMKNAEDFHKCT